METYQLEQLTVRGRPQELGEQVGEAFRERIQEFVDVRFRAVTQYAADRGRDSIEGLLDIGRASQAVFAAWDAPGYQEHVGIARGANVDPLDLYTVTNMTDMRDALLIGDADWPHEEGCTSVMVPDRLATAGRAIVGQTWDLNPSDVEFIVAIHRQPDTGPETWSLTCTGCLTLVGMNSNGLAVGTTNIKVRGAKPGVGYLSLLHRAVRSRDAAEASEHITTAPRAGAHTYWLADPTQQLEWEVSATDAVKRAVDAEPVTRSNHCLAPQFSELQGEPTSDSSRKRIARALELTREGDVNLDRMKALFSDRSQGLDSINRYHEDGTGTATNGVFVGIPAEKRLWACRGPADRGEWVEFGW